MKKGFTLIELLAVIVILAIIALIAVPIVLNIIGESRDEAKLRSAELYSAALEQSIANHMMNTGTKLDLNECVVISEDKVKCDGKEIKVKVNGEFPDVSSVVIFNKGKIKEAKLYYGDKVVIKNEDSEFYLGDTNKIGETHIALLESQIKKAYGKDIKIGDYVEYDETKGGTVTVEKDVKWRVLGIENGNLLLLSDQNIASKKINGKTYNSDEELLNIINEPCKAYGQGDYIVEARSVSVEDVNKITGFNPYRVLKGGVYGAYHEGRITEYRNEVTYTYGKDSNGNRILNMDSTNYKSSPGDLNVSLEYLEPKTFMLYDKTLLGYEDNIAMNTKKTITVKSDYYWYSPEILTSLSLDEPEDVEEYNSMEKVGIKKGTQAYDMLFANTTWPETYWLSDIFDFTLSNTIWHGMRSVGDGKVGLGGSLWHPIEIQGSSGSTHGSTKWNGVRAVVALDSNVTLTKNGENTWNIQSNK